MLNYQRVITVVVLLRVCSGGSFDRADRLSSVTMIRYHCWVAFVLVEAGDNVLQLQ